MKQQQAPADQVVLRLDGTPRRSRLRLSWGRGTRPDSSSAQSSQRVLPQVWPLLRYLDELEEWSHRAWSGAGVRRPWLPDVVRNQLREQWWVEARVPPASLLRSRIATFWTGVIPWLAWNPQAERLPDPPAEPELLARIVGSLDRELQRMGQPVAGSERAAALRSAIRRLELLGSTGPGRRLNRQA